MTGVVSRLGKTKYGPLLLSMNSGMCYTHVITAGSQRQKTQALEHQTLNDALVSKLNAAIIACLDEEGYDVDIDPRFEIPK